MKVQPNLESQKKFASDYFIEERFVKRTYEYEYNEQSRDTIHIAFNIDKNFCRPLGVTITSILENNKDTNLCFHIFIDDIYDDDKDKLFKTMAKYHQNCYIYIMNIEEFTGFHIKHKRFKHVSYFRLYMNKVLEKLTDKFIYLDADLICLRSMKPFLDVDLEGKTIAAVADLPGAVAERSAYLGLEYGNYLDSGVLIIDCKAWEKRHITEKCFSYQGVPAEKFTCHDQDVLNLVLDGDVRYIDDKFNHLGLYTNNEPNDCIIYHFFGRDKPWVLAVSESEKKWRKYLQISLWDNIEGELPPKKGKYYFSFKRAGEYYKIHKRYSDYLNCRFWYSLLKIINYIGL